MILHKDKDAFRTLIELVHERTGYRADVLEKDYYVVLILEELATMQSEGLPAYFKGGTALYKAMHLTNRFSEDIDLSVDTRDCTRAQNEKRLAKAAKKYSVLQRDKSQGKTNRSEVISGYIYEPVTVFDKDDMLQRFGKVKIEATSFTISEPVEELEISTMLYEYANEEQRRVLETMYEVNPFRILTITMERIFIDKLFAAESYVQKSDEPMRAFEAAKHIYDLNIMIEQKRIRSLIKDSEKMKYLLDIRMKEEKERLDGIAGIMPSEFCFFYKAPTDDRVAEAYDIMQRQYVLRDEDCIEYTQAMHTLMKIQGELSENSAWHSYSVAKS